MLEKAIDALESVDFGNRDITNMTMAINPKRISEAKAMIARFRRKMAKVMETGPGRTEVYTVAVQFFPLTQIRKGRNP
jgi:uncharacterized protein (TIGR02147 family)